MVTQPLSVSRNRALWLFIPLVFLYSLSYFQRTALPGTIYNTLANEFGLNAAQMANLGAAFVYPYALCQLVSGVLIDRFCGTRVVIGGGILFVLGALMFPLASGTVMLYCARILAGIGASTMFLCLVRETDRFFGRKNYAVMFGIAYSCGYTGGLMGTLPFERLCYIFTWRYVLLAAGILSLAAYLAVVMCRNRIPLPAIPRKSFSLEPFRFIIRNPLTWLLLICSNNTFCIYFIIQTFFGKKFLEDFAGFSSGAAAAVIFTLTLTCIATMLITSFLTRFTGNRRRPLILVSCGLCAAGSILMVLAICGSWPGWSFALLYCMFALAAGVPPIYSMIIQEVNAKEVVAQSTAFCNMAGYLAVAIGAQLAGVLLDCFDRVPVNGQMVYPPEAYRMIFIILSVISVAVFLISWKIPETRGHYLHLHINKLPEKGEI